MMDRRAFIAGTLSLLAAPLAVEAQPAGKVYRIGILGNVPLTDREGARLWGAFTEGLRELGYVEGQNITIERRFSEGRYERLPALAAELVRLHVDVIVVPATQNPLAAKQATQTIPIVMTSGGDPVASGLVASLAHPGGNLTGLSVIVTPEIVGKQLELLKEIAPRVPRVALLGNPANASYQGGIEAARRAAQALGIRLAVLDARGPDDFGQTFAAMTSDRVGALLVSTDGMFILYRSRIIDLAARHHLPAMYGTSEFVDAGGLMFYGPSLRDNFRRAATYVDKILKGAKPADLPVEQPTKFELIINLKTAKGLGVTIPPSVLARTDEVIE
jgi:putative tryptophan/tyrosine transport system substrate-binding protein